MAAFGGLPHDFRTNPPMINYTDPKTLDAIKQALDLAKAGYIQYNELGSLTGGGGGRIPNADIVTQNLNAFFRGQGPGGGRSNGRGARTKATPHPAAKDSFESLTFPTGTHYN